ncbi:MAG: ATP-dependent DNA helicase RecG [Clostridium sp.]|nr:ATP-dependent DNA helicase RecG [Prevotella sp.]MCM1429477.1 ATP-dependent DNA helicase RecG [Clostridium sp.]
MTLDQLDIKYLRGIGEKRSKAIAKELGDSSFLSLLFHMPLRYADRSKFYMISELREDMSHVQLRGRFVSFNVLGEGAKKRLVAAFSDGKRLMEVVWFSKIQTLREMYSTGKEYVIFGKPTYFNNMFSMSHPEVDPYDPTKPKGGLQAIYPLSDGMRRAGVTQRSLATALRAIVGRREFQELRETLPTEIIQRHNLMEIREALYNIHFPATPDALSRAKLRLKYEELFYLELNIVRFARRRTLSSRGHLLQKVGNYFNSFYFNVLPFELTGAQKRVIREIRKDVNSGRQMNRLLQGDVGSGKTMVAFMAMLLAVDNGYQAALMAPTEILANQHYDTLTEWCNQLGLRCRLLTGNSRSKSRRETLAGLANGEIDIIVGTHALIEDKVEIKNLGMAIIDEQHRFGVAQRARMWGKNDIPPHVLVMTATPIPRTLAMTVYGDLEVSVIDELPPGRKPVTTMLAYDENRTEINMLINNQLKQGRQVYIVYPLVHESEKLAAKSAEEGYERIMGLFPEYPVSIVHGQLGVEKKEREMRKFVEGETRIMVATTVIEVGVNVPNASVMVIENAERFGLSQLHQLRGRVGRGADKSYCILVGKQKMSADTRKRLTIMTETTDGFVVSEADMKLRGPGDMEGTQQSGLAFNLRVANLASDGQILSQAREDAIDVVDHKERFSNMSLRTMATEIYRRFSREADWSRIS